ncbi:hypothetical protein [Streptomyces avicenniae]|uniref:hypothetical protein n=1 Tax=Streptomyces avicenniae TaxID=500153 RepID=UPI00069C38C2|nr:hypothetical protein [Streptomyces avicenniae]
MADQEAEHAVIFEIIRKQLDIIQLITSADGAGPGTAPEAAEIRERVATIFHIEDSQVSIASRSGLEKEETTVTGDSFSNIGAGATVINRSLLANSLNRVGSAHGPETEAALARVAEIVEEAGNEEAAENFNALSAELAEDTPRRGVLRALWAGVVTALPTVTELTSLGEQLGGVLG